MCEISERIACRNPTPSGVGQGKLFNKRKAANSRFVTLSGGRISSLQGVVLQLTEKIPVLKEYRMDTPLGQMIAVADEQVLYLLEFVDRRGLAAEMAKLQTKSTIISGKTDPIDSIENELHRYFDGLLTDFQTPVKTMGTLFQKEVWAELLKISVGKTCSYSDVALAIKKQSAFRAVARANSANQLVIIIPCHRVINKNGDLGGYSGGMARKRWLLAHEEKMVR